jgi:hypothetical protein
MWQQHLGGKGSVARSTVDHLGSDYSRTRDNYTPSASNHYSTRASDHQPRRASNHQPPCASNHQPPRGSGDQPTASSECNAHAADDQPPVTSHHQAVPTTEHNGATNHRTHNELHSTGRAWRRRRG